MRDSDWKILEVLYEKRSITQTAELLYMTQPSVTKRIKAMEEEWQIEIVKRSNRGVIFTEEGRYLVQKSYIIQDFMKEIKDHFAHKHVAKELLRIGVPNSFAKLHMPSLLKGYTDALNELQIKTVANSSDVVVRHLMDGTIDIGIVCGDYPYLGKKIHLFTEDLYIAAPQGVSIDEIEDMPLIKSFLNPMVEMIVDQWWKNQFGTRAHESQYVPFIDIAIEMVEKDLGVAFLFGNDWKINEEKVQLIPAYDLQGEPVKRDVWMMISDKCYQSQTIVDFIDFVEKFYQDEK